MKIILLILSIVFIAGCATKQIKKKDSTSYVETKGEIGSVKNDGIKKPDEYGPPIPNENVVLKNESPKNEMKQTNSSDKEAEYALLLGPGFARTLAYIGVLKVLEEKEFRIRAVMGVEMGALIASIWSGSNANKLEWEMFKFDKDTFREKKLMGGYGGQSEGKNLEKYISKVFSNRRIEDSKLKNYIPVSSKEMNSIQLISKGMLNVWTRVAMSVPGILKAQDENAKQRFSVSIDKPYPVEEFREKSPGKILCVDVLGNKPDIYNEERSPEFFSMMKLMVTTAQNNLKQCDDVMTIELDNAGMFDFDAKADLVFKGKEAAEKWYLGKFK